MNDLTDLRIGETCNREVVYAARDTTIQAAAKLMRHYHVGSLVVIGRSAGDIGGRADRPDPHRVQGTGARNAEPKIAQGKTGL